MKQEQWFRPYVTAYFWRFLLIVILGVLTILSASMLMFTSGYLISKSALRPENILMVYVPVVGVRTFGISRAVMHYVERLVGHDTILRILSKMRVRLYQLLEPQALRFSSRFKTGDLLGVLADDIEYLQDVYIRTVFPAIVALVLYGGTIIAIGTFDPWFALLMAAYVFLLVFVLPIVSLLFTKRKNREIKNERAALYQKLTDAVLGMGEWFISGRQKDFLTGYEQDEASVDRTDRSLKRWGRFRGFISQCVVAAIVLSMVYWSGQQYADGHIDVTLIAAFVLVVFPLMDAFLPISEAVERIPQYEQSINRLNGIKEEVPDHLQGAGSQAGMTRDEAAAIALNGVHVKVEDVFFDYGEQRSGDRPTVGGLSLDIPQGAKIAVIGRSGAGKSTLLNLIQGVLSPVEGRITMNGTDAYQFGDGMASVVSVLNQSPHLFDTTLANNLRLGRMNASDEDLQDAVRRARLSDLVDSLPEGFETRMQETGQRFSGGERQRVALARILLQDTPVVILDEPTVGLDPKTERELLSTMFASLKGKSLIWVTHHLVGVEQMDEIVFMEEGCIVMRGTHAELMKRYPRYRHLYELDRPVQL
ncbi:ATP-binding cassette, subfamily C, CydC [Paenibacillus uliginis N3/975]|uniref:ATP-binding cassette, subfamily C, CydC n=1 Tax=Paenibacillus uliginis N3/975 TaxID=1313296 RepID=A0A1X7G8K0_9BACL|nr:thiol reductant ABC exporter subunit CydC [Paenibacillus uliginis]SMF65844.1 ATP-binding cassette, subfamily C, CydC [Paenibacillus uliginis N3/975]